MIKLAQVAKDINRHLLQNKRQLPSVDEFLDGVCQIVSEGRNLIFSSLRSQVQSVKLAAETAGHCNFNQVVGKPTE